MNKILILLNDYMDHSLRKSIRKMKSNIPHTTIKNKDEKGLEKYELIH